jgi:two-component system OmpR family sensor kinase
MGLEAAGANGRGGLPPEQLSHLRTYLGIIHRESVRLGELVDDLLTLARSEADELRLDLAPVDAAGVVNEVHETLAPLAWRDRSVTLIKETPEGLPPVQADRARLVQVLLNLVRNAITHTPAGGIVSLTIEPDEREGEQRIALVVSDTGSGIPPGELDKVFERFYRVDASRSRASGGFGLGLAIVRDLVTAMGGTVGASSTVGEGSSFRVSLRSAEHTRRLETTPGRAAAPAPPVLPAAAETPTLPIVPPSKRPEPVPRA